MKYVTSYSVQLKCSSAMAENRIDENAKSTVDHFNDFWDSIETTTGSHIPGYIRNILNFNGFNSPMNMALLTDEDITAIENDVKSNKILDTVLEAGLEPFRSSNEFFFPRGYRKLLLSIAESIRTEGPRNILRQRQAVTVNSSKLQRSMNQGITRIDTTKYFAFFSFTTYHCLLSGSY